MSTDESQSVGALVGTLPLQSFRLPKVDFTRHDFRSKVTKLSCNVLVASGPLHVETGKPVAVRELIDQRGTHAFEQVVPGRHVDDKDFEKGDVFRGTSNRMLHPHLFDGASIWEVLRKSESISPQVLESHAISPEAAAALREERYIDFLKRREEALERRATVFFEERCGVR